MCSVLLNSLKFAVELQDYSVVLVTRRSWLCIVHGRYLLAVAAAIV